MRHNNDYGNDGKTNEHSENFEKNTLMNLVVVIMIPGIVIFRMHQIDDA